MSVLRIPRSLSRACASAVILGALLTACGGGGGSGDPAPTEPPATPTGLTVTYDVKAYAFTWDAMPGATSYVFFEDPDGPGPLPAAQMGGNLSTNSTRVNHGVLLHERLNAQYTVSACNALGCSTPTAALQPDLIKAIGYFKASNTVTNHSFGAAVAVSADGTTLAVGVPGDDSASADVSNSPPLPFSGAVYVYVRDAIGIWGKQAYVKASNPDRDDLFGSTLALSADGNTLAVGAPGEDSKGFKVGDTQEDDTQMNSGAVYVFARSPAGGWSQQAYVKASNTEAYDDFGYSIALSGDGDTLAVGAPGEDGDANTPIPDSGAVYMYVRTGGTWSWKAYLKADSPQVDAGFGIAVALSMNGETLAIGSPGESTTADYSGAAYVFTRDGANWTQSKFIKASNAGEDDGFGTSVSLSGDGSTLAVGAPAEASNGSDKSNDDLYGAGAIYVFVRSENDWTEQAYIKASNPGEHHYFGTSISLSADGSKVAVGAPLEGSAAKGINGPQSDDTALTAGAAYLFGRAGSTWTQHAYVKASNTRSDQFFGISVGLSGDGMKLAVGAPFEDGRASGINGDQEDQDPNISFNSGAVYLY